jgi:putative SOS response-associated peptidase YedK
MCGRFTLTARPETVAALFELPEVPLLEQRYNIAPTQSVVVVRRTPDAAQRELVFLRWGLVPCWAADRTIGNRLVNARAETVADKPAFRAAFRERRCLVAADGFYEWQPQGKGKKQPFLFRLRDHSPFAFAGLWERWRSPDGTPLETCTLLTTEANAVVRPVHERMPVLLTPESFEQWLDPTPRGVAELQRLLQPVPAEKLIAQPVSSRVNNPRYDDPACLEPLAVLPFAG